MRDIVNYHTAELVATEGNPLEAASPLRQDYLRRFADREGREFLFGFYGRYRDLDRDGILAEPAGRVRQSSASLAVTFRSLRDRTSVVKGKSVSVRVDLGGG